ncbi:MAG TPA: maleylpyruvate isomerase N-terminal domain-containing protein [Streptosporangiaceae bacterium]|nr:maleylpyruvate isomerase N-terminal domain-containing protein [Streptosporangiaceae bacterium]
MTQSRRIEIADALESAYRNITALADGLTDADLMLPSRCAGWAVGDVLYHQLLDARRALRTFASPAAEPPDTDQVGYWRFYPAQGEAAEAHRAENAENARYVRIVASAYPPGALAWEWRETSAAACRAARACTHEAVTTQGHVLTTADFMSTLTVEAAVHYLDLTVALPSAPPPDPDSLAIVRWVLGGLLGRSMPGEWDDQACALKGTGRAPLTAEDRVELGELADRLPLFG